MIEVGRGRKLKIGAEMSEEDKNRITDLLMENEDVFAWAMDEMTGISPKVAIHQLNVDPHARPVRQKRRPYSVEKNQLVLEETRKLKEAGYIREVYYPEWVANPVLVRKANGSWRMCIDFTDLNKAGLKDSYPLPRIDSWLTQHPVARG